MSIRKCSIAWGLVASAQIAAADQVFLKGGGRLDGEIVDRTQRQVTVDVGPGQLTLPMERVDRITEGTSPLRQFRERADRLAPGDAAGWLALALWARERGLATQAAAAFEHVLALDPNNSVAQSGLGRVRLGDRWVTPDESMRAQGYVQFDGRWVTLNEQEALLRERQAEALLRAQIEAQRTAPPPPAPSVSGPEVGGIAVGGYPLLMGFPTRTSRHGRFFHEERRPVENPQLHPRVSTHSPSRVTTRRLDAVPGAPHSTLSSSRRPN
jgi:hypothetical protein